MPNDGAGGDQFGFSVALSGNVAVVGSVNDGDNGPGSGSAYIFQYNGSAWEQQAKLIADDGSDLDKFGFSVSISGSAAAVGAYGDDDNGSNSGSAYIFRFGGSVWEQEAKLTADDAASGDWFGYSVSISGNAVIAGAREDDDHGSSSGSAYVFRYDHSTWDQAAKLMASDGARGDLFGDAVSLDGNVAVIGAFQDNDNGTDSGSAYVFLIPGDCNSDGSPDECDIAFGTSADCQPDWVPDDCQLAGNDCNVTGVPDDCEAIGAGDFDGDGDVDLADFAGFETTLAGPETLPNPPAPECLPVYLEAFDFDGDHDVDLFDFGAFQKEFTGQ
jgi:hypothetical protein